MKYLLTALVLSLVISCKDKSPDIIDPTSTPVVVEPVELMYCKIAPMPCPSPMGPLVSLEGKSCPTEGHAAGCQSETYKCVKKADCVPYVAPKGVIVLEGDFSPMCPVKPGYVAPKAGDECEPVGSRVCSGGVHYVCKAK